jgi:16S rRNA (cytosine967-C5)-methyltransferase
MKKTRDKARHTALQILNRRDVQEVPVDGIMDSTFSGTSQTKQDKAFIHNLVFGVLRWRGRLDWIIKHFSHIKIHNIDPKVLNILRLGLFQILHLTRVPVSAAVNTSVELAKSVADVRTVRYVNAVLRKASVGVGEVVFPDFKKNPIEAIAATYAFPEWLVERWMARYSLQETIALCKAANVIPPITVRTNLLKTDRASLLTMLQHEAEDIQATTHSELGISFYRPKLPVSKLPSYQKGWFQVQDEAAQLVSQFFNPQPQENILDACAGLGGKTGHIAQLMSNQGRIIAMDNHKQRLSQLRTEMMHLGINIVTTNFHDLNQPFDRTPSRMFDRILLDAPCSGLGVIRRNPDAKWIPSKMNLQTYHQRQTTFLNLLAPQVKIGGILQYVVCSLEPEENEHVVNSFMQSCANFSVKTSPDLPSNLKSFVDADGYFRTVPSSGNMDGFFAVRFRRTS